jgi:hypothetical protein
VFPSGYVKGGAKGPAKEFTGKHHGQNRCAYQPGTIVIQ